MSEAWKAVPGFERFYEVSDLGRVRSLERIDAVGRRIAGRTLKPATLRKGYRNVALYLEGHEHRRYVHRLVLVAFVGPPPEGMEACHNNGQPEDNRLKNLRWDTPSANNLDRVRHGTNPNAAKTQCPQAHPYDAANTYVRPAGGRECRTCKRARRASHAR